MTAHQMPKSWARSAWEVLAAALLYLVLALAATYPAMNHWSTEMMGGSWDTGQNIWNFWWLGQSVRQGDFLPYFTRMLYAPDGASLAYHPLALFNGYQALILQRMLGATLPAAYNTIAAASFVAAALCAYWLVKKLTHNPAAALVAGIVFAFAPAHVSRLHFGHLEIFTSAGFVPLVALAAMTAARKHRMRYTVLTAVLIAAIGWQSLQIALGAGFLAGLLFLLFGDVRRQWRRLLGQWLLLTIMVAAMLLPVIYPMLRDFADFRDPSDPTSAYMANSADLFDFFLPDVSVSSFWRMVLKTSGESAAALFQGRAQRTVFVGFTVLALCIVALFVVDHKLTWRWWTVAGVFFLVSLGPVLQVGGQALALPLPYAALAQLPVLGLGRVPARYGVFVVLALAVIVGYCIDELGRRWSHRYLAALLPSVLIFVEVLAVPINMDNRLVTMPAYYREIMLPAANERAGSVLDVPYDLAGAIGPACDYMVYQTIHQRPIVSGYISRAPQPAVHMLDSLPFVHQLRARQYGDAAPVEFSPSEIANGRQELEALQVEYVILHKKLVSYADAQVMEDALTSAIRMPVYEDEDIVVWHLPSGATNG